MTQRTEDWSNNWKSSKNPSKQRKYRDNAPLHVKDNIISANLSSRLRDELGTRNINIRTGDRAKIMRGDEKGSEGIINKINRVEEQVYIDGIENERTDGSKQQKPLRPSNLQLVALNVDESNRIEKYEVEDIASVEVDEEELEEALEEDEEQEMMEQMQAGQSGAHEQYEEENEEDSSTSELEDEEEKNGSETEIDYSKIVSGTISDGKEQVKDLENVDYSKIIEAEKEGKNRTTFIEWLEKQAEA